MVDALGRAPVGVVVASVAYAVGAAATIAEVGWHLWRGDDRRGHLRDAATAATMVLGATVVGVLYTALFVALWSLAGTLRPAAAVELWDAHPLIATVAALVLWDLGFWLYHAVGHHTRVGWAAHAPHHSGTSFDLTLGLRQPWFPFHGLLIWPWLAVTGLPLDLTLTVGAVGTVWQLLVHTSAAVRVPRWIGAVVVTPAAHRHHHARHGGAVNLGGILTVWDRLAGTWVGPDRPRPTCYGTDPTGTTNPLVLELGPWLELIRPASPPGHRPGRPGRRW